MRRHAIVSGSVVAAIMAVVLGPMSLAAQSQGVKPSTPVTVSAGQEFALLKGVKALPMASSELEAVKGLHVHFFTPSKNIADTPFGPTQGIHFAGDVKTQNNWSNAWGGSDGVAVAPSYKGLCVATGLSGPGGGIVSIPQGHQQCPLP